MYPLFAEKMYGNTASLCHLDDHDTSMHNVVHIHDCVSGMGGAVILTKKGKKMSKSVCEDGSSVIKKLSPVKLKYSESIARLLEMNTELSKGAKTSKNDGNDLVLTYPDGLTI